MDKPLINRVANSGLITLNLEDHYPKQEIHEFDIKDYLFQGLLLREKDFRAALKEHDWSKYDGTTLLIYCSSDAIIPVWAYMLVASYAKKAAAEPYQGDKLSFLREYFNKQIASIDVSQYAEKRIVIKGCSNKPVPPSAYASLTAVLQDYAQSIMYGEPCSTVPVFKRPRKV
jgi:hypothetical protein